MKLNKKGQCPECRIKPLKYMRSRHFFCHRCDRAYDLETKEHIENWMWKKNKEGILRRNFSKV